MGPTQRQIPIVCPGHTRPLAEIQFCNIETDDEKRSFLVSACHDKSPMLRDGQTGDWIGTFSGHKGAVWSAKLDPLGYLAATASGDFDARVWDAISGKCLYIFPHKHIVKTVDFSPNSKLLATGGHEGILRIYDLMECASKKGATDPSKTFTFSFEKENTTKPIIITKCVWWGNEKILVAGNDGKIRVLDVKTGSVIDSIDVVDCAEVRDMEVKTIGSAASNTSIVIAAAGKQVYLFDLVQSKLLSTFDMPIHFKDEGGVSLHPSGTRFIAGGSDLWVRVFESATGKEIDCLKGHHGPIRCLRYASDGDTFASGSEDGTIRLWKS